MTTARDISVTIAATMAIAACASFQPKPIDPAANLAAFESRSLADPGLKNYLEASLHRDLGPWPPRSLNLQTLALIGLYDQPDLAVARTRVAVAEAGVITAGARPNPSLDLIGQFNADAANGASPWTYGGSLAFPVETARKRDYRVEQARFLSESARLGSADAAWGVWSQVRANLLALHLAERSAQAVQTQKALQEQIVGLLERRLALGLVSTPEVTQARIALNRLTLALDEARKQSAERRAQLASAVGLPVGELEDVDFSAAEFEQVPAAADLPSRDARRQALLHRPDILAALARYQASQSALQLEIARQYPDVSLGPGYLWDEGAAKWSVALVFALPVLNRNQGPIAEAEARRSEAAASFTALQARAIGEVAQALAGYRAAARKLASADAVLATQKELERSAAAAFEAGEDDRLGLLSARFLSASAELGRLETLVQAQQSLGLLEDAVRQPLGADAPIAVSPETGAARKEEQTP